MYPNVQFKIVKLQNEHKKSLRPLQTGLFAYQSVNNQAYLTTNFLVTETPF